MVVIGTKEVWQRLSARYGEDTPLIDVIHRLAVTRNGKYVCHGCGCEFPKGEAWLDDSGVWCGDCGKLRFRAALRALAARELAN